MRSVYSDCSDSVVAARSWFASSGDSPFINLAMLRPSRFEIVGDGFSDVLWYGPGGAVDFMWFGSPTPGDFTGVRTNIRGRESGAAALSRQARC